MLIGVIMNVGVCIGVDQRETVRRQWGVLLCRLSWFSYNFTSSQRSQTFMLQTCCTNYYNTLFELKTQLTYYCRYTVF